MNPPHLKLLWAMASGLQQNPRGFEVAVVMTRWMFPYIGFMSLVALAAGDAAAHHHGVVGRAAQIGHPWVPPDPPAPSLGSVRSTPSARSTTRWARAANTVGSAFSTRVRAKASPTSWATAAASMSRS